MASAEGRLLLLFVLVSQPVMFSSQSFIPETDEFLGPAECLEKKFTRGSCDLVFCPPWQYCVQGQCSCKPAYKCPTEGLTKVCGLNSRRLNSYCQAMAVSCQTKRPFMSHFGETCAADQLKFSSSIDDGTTVVRLILPGTTGAEEVLVCQKMWDMAAANVACRHQGHSLGASSIDTVSYVSLLGYYDNQQLPDKCVSVRCQGYENSLAECVIYDKRSIGSDEVATATCAEQPDTQCQVTCVNSKCVSLSQTCDGVDDCGDRSDEMCCKRCRNGAFRCSTGVCVHAEAVDDGQIDCLDGEDESEKHKNPVTSLPVLSNTEFISPKRETRATRLLLESKLACGIANTTEMIDHDFMRGPRVKRVVGGLTTKPTQIQWQVDLQIRRRFQCGGAYIGGCWVLTAAHCLGTNPSLSIPTDGGSIVSQRPPVSEMVVRFSIWKRFSPQASTDLVPVLNVFIHPMYNVTSRENDIALVELEKLPYSDQCLPKNPAVSAVCVPWTTRLFHPNHTCTISGWGQTQGVRRSLFLQWANVPLIEDCHRFYSDHIKPGMICAGELDGSVGACEGDNGGPLVCEDELGVSYLWGILSWGRGCGQQRSPSVYTQVAYYFEWIRQHTGWPAVTKFNA